MVKTDQGEFEPRYTKIPWPRYEEMKQELIVFTRWFCIQVVSKFFKYVNSCKDIYFNLKLHFRKFRKNLENAASAIFIKIWESVILRNFEKQFLSTQIQHWIIIITNNSRPIKFLISVCPTNTLDGLIIHDKH